MAKKKGKHEIGKNLTHAYDIAVIANTVIQRVSDNNRLTKYEVMLLRGWLIEIEDALQNVFLAISASTREKDD